MGCNLCGYTTGSFPDHRWWESQCHQRDAPSWISEMAVSSLYTVLRGWPAGCDSREAPYHNAMRPQRPGGTHPGEIRLEDDLMSGCWYL